MWNTETLFMSAGTSWVGSYRRNTKFRFYFPVCPGGTPSHCHPQAGKKPPFFSTCDTDTDSFPREVPALWRTVSASCGAAGIHLCWRGKSLLAPRRQSDCHQRSQNHCSCFSTLSCLPPPLLARLGEGTMESKFHRVMGPTKGCHFLKTIKEVNLILEIWEMMLFRVSPISAMESTKSPMRSFLLALSSGNSDSHPSGALSIGGAHPHPSFTQPSRLPVSVSSSPLRTSLPSLPIFPFLPAKRSSRITLGY